VLERAGGVPFVLVSCAQGLSDGDTGPEAVPWDVAQSVRQRVAALPEEAGEVLGAAAVVGRVVSPAVLGAAAARPQEEVLTALDLACRARLLVDEAHGYCFAHDVIREVIEGDLGTARRRAAHRRVAAAIEAVHADRLPDQYETLAYHSLQGEVWEKAVDYLVASGDKAVGTRAIQEGLSFYAQALAVCDRLGPAARATTAAVAEKRGFLRFVIADFPGAAADFAQMCAAATRVGDGHRTGLALAYRGLALLYGHDFAAAEETVRGALGAAGEGFDDVRFLASVVLGEICVLLNRHAEAAPLLSVAEELAPRVDDPFSQAMWCDLGGTVRLWRGDFDEAIAFAEHWRGAVEASHDLGILLWVTWEEALAHGGKGNYERALALLDDAIATCDRVGELFVRARAVNTKAWIYGELQDHRRALELNTQSFEAARAIETANPEIQNNARLNLGDTLVALGRPEEAAEHYRAVEQTIRYPRPQDHFMLWRYAQHLFHSYGEWWLNRGEIDKAQAYADECLALAESSASRKNVVKACRLRGQALLAQGKPAEAEPQIGRALEVARQIGNPPQLWKTYVALGELRQVQGRAQDAREAYRCALAIIDRVAAALTDASLRETFLTSAHVQHIRQTEQTFSTPQNAPPDGASVPARPSLPARHGVVPGAPAGRGLSRTERQAWALAHLRTAGPLSPRAYATALGVSVDTGLRDLQELVDRGLVQAAGTTRDRRYVLVGEAVGPAIPRTAL
jgi:tetratricopeptide (TPR) repeat protein